MPIFKKDDPTIKLDADSIVNQIEKEEIKNLTPYRKTDNWSNIMSGLNQTKDKSRYTTFSGYTILDDNMLAEVWIGDGLGKKIISTPIDDMTREWITIKNDTDEVINGVLEGLDAQQNINLGMKWSGLFGGGINVLGVNDGGGLDKPVNVKSIKSIDWIRTYDRSECYITEHHFNQDPESKDFGELEFLTIQPRYSTPYNVHIDRMLLWKGVPVPNKFETGDFYYWGMSELQSIWKQFSNLGAGMDHIVKLLYEFIIGVYKIDGLAQMIAENNKSQVEDIMGIIELAKSIIQGVLLDSKDDYRRDSANVAGLAELIDRFMMMLSGAAEIPVSKLFGRSAAGMNATGEGDEKDYYNMIRSKQKTRMTKNLMKLVNYINISLKNAVTDPSIEYNSLFQQTQKEELECKKLRAETDHIYIQDNVLLPDEVAENRFGGEAYSYETTNIEVMSRELPEPEMTEEEKIRMQFELKNGLNESKKIENKLPQNNANVKMPKVKPPKKEKE